MNLELMAMVWLRVEKRCEIVLRERSPRSWQCGEPDVLGITPARYMVEIEVKRSYSDFLADGRKRHRIVRNQYIHKHPRQFYYLVEHDLIEKVEPKLPDWAGLMFVETNQIIVKKNAPLNQSAEKLTFRECRRFLSLLTNHLLSSESSRECERNWFKNNHNPWIPEGVINYEI